MDILQSRLAKPAGSVQVRRLYLDCMLADLSFLFTHLLFSPQVLSDHTCSKRRRVLETAAPAARAQQDKGDAYILNGQGRRVPFPAVDWQTNSKSYAAFIKRHKATSAPFRLTMGLEPLCSEDWIEVRYFMLSWTNGCYFLSDAAQRYKHALASR